MSDTEIPIKQWDVFISHASEDKETVAIPLAGWFTRAGLRVWLDAQELKIGDSLREKIEHGLAESRFGVVIISEIFLAKRWPQQELNGLTALEEDGQKVILPVWHNVTKLQVARVSPILADRLAANTQNGLRQIAREILNVVIHRTSNSPSTLVPNIIMKLVQLIESDSPLTELKDFIFMHGEILAWALGCEAVLNRPDSSRPSTMFFARKITTGEELRFVSVALGPTSGPLFNKRKKPVAELMNLISAVPKHGEEEEKNVILMSRRDRLDEVQKKCLKDMNVELRSKAHIEVRTYDWLIDVFVRMAPRVVESRRPYFLRELLRGIED